MRVILNPMARGGAGRRLRGEIERALIDRHGGFQIVETAHSGHGVDLAAGAVHDGVSTIVAAGGDGTIHEVANGVLNALDDAPRDVAFGIIPIGTGNDFAKVVPGARSLSDALQTLNDGHPRPFDVGVAEWAGNREYFLNAMGTGVDVEVVRQIQRMERGNFVYLRGLMRALALYSPVQLRIQADDTDISARVMLVAVANGTCVGGSFRIAPRAVTDDGRLDLCIVSEMPRLAQLAIVPRIIAGSHESHPRVFHARVESVTLSAVGGIPLFFQLDGELREPADVRQVRVTIQRARLQIIAAPGHA
ncbi:MAG: diacylglycerol kinase family protein [Longimicrobiales bacterium]